MKIVEIDATTKLEHLLKELQITEEEGLELTVVPDQATILDNNFNRKILEKAAKQFKKEIVFPSLPIEESTPAETDDLGFVEGEDVISKVPVEEVKKMLSTPEAKTQISSPRKFRLPSFIKNRSFLIGAGTVLLLIIVGSFLFLLPSATVTLTLATQAKEEQMNLTADPSLDSVDVLAAKVPVQTKTQTEEGSDQVTATGKKSVGTAAKGHVTIFNQFTGSGRTFSAGTLLTQETGATTSATFTLDNDVTVDKAPPGGSSQAGVTVTATKAGTDGNIKAGVIFKIGDNPDYLYYAKGDTDFSGGSTKQINVASQVDKDSLRQKLIQSLTDKAQAVLEKNLGGAISIQNATDVQTVNEVYTPPSLDTETTVLKADIKIQATAYLVKKNDLKAVLLNRLKNNLPNGYQISAKDMSFDAKLVAKNPDGTLSIKGILKASLVPQLSVSTIKNHLVGRSSDGIKNYLNSLNNVTGYKVDIGPAFFQILGRMPFLANRIKIVYN